MMGTSNDEVKDTHTPENDDSHDGSYQLEQIGGHMIVDCKPVFSDDSMYLFLASGSEIRQYVTESGALLNTKSTQHKTNIINLMFDPRKKSELLSVSQDGLIYSWNVEEDLETQVFQINMGMIDQVISHCQLIGHTFYYLVDFIAAEKCYLFHADMNKQTLFNHKTLVKNSKTSMAFGPSKNPQFCVTIYKNTVNIHEIPYNEEKPNRIQHKLSPDKSFECVACHPDEHVFATGDSLGRITLWQNDFLSSNHPTKTVMHWHQMPVADLCFSREASFLYSVGAELTLVRWNISAVKCGEKNYLPRLGMPMKYVTCDANHEYIVTCHENNSILIIGSQLDEVKTKIEGLECERGKGYPLSNRMLYNSRLKSLITPGRPGHVQFYSPMSRHLLYQLEIVQQNILSQERNKEIFMTQVCKIDVSEDGIWLATLEMRQDFETMIEMRLKFWESTERKFTMNTIIHLPHKRPVNNVRFSADAKYLVSTSEDKCVKIWHQISRESVKTIWICGQILELNNCYIPGLSAWSCDNSLLAVTFKDILTIWNASDEKQVKLRRKIRYKDKDGANFKFIEFGKHGKSHYLLEVKSSVVRVWDIIKLQVLWNFNPTSAIECVALHPLSNVIAIFTQSQLIMFNIDSDTKIDEMFLESSSRMKAATFVADNPDSLLDSLYCINQNQELFTLNCSKGSSSQTNFTLAEFIQPATPFAMILMNKNKLKVLDNQSTVGFEVSAQKVAQEMFLKVPSHVLPPINKLTKDFLSSLMKLQEIAKKDIETYEEYLSQVKESKKDKIENKNTKIEVDIVGTEMDIQMDVENVDLSWIDDIF